MWGQNPRISAWSNADPMCPPACTGPPKTTLRTSRVDWPSHINVLRLSRAPALPATAYRARGVGSKRLFDGANSDTKCTTLLPGG